MDAIKLLHTRYSASKLSEPAPSAEALRVPLGAMWKTGDAAYDDTVKSALGIDTDDLIVGFIHVGTDTGAPKTRTSRSLEEFARHWTGAVPA